MVAECVFCEILAGRAPGNVVCEDDLAAAFIDPRQYNPGHVLVVPRTYTHTHTHTHTRRLGDGRLLVYPSAAVDADPIIRASYAERLRQALAYEFGR